MSPEALQTCPRCGEDWFAVHTCPAGPPQRPPAKVRREQQSIAVLHLTDHIRDLEETVRRQQETITGLMLELADLREVLALKQEQAREVMPG